MKKQENLDFVMRLKVIETQLLKHWTAVFNGYCACILVYLTNKLSDSFINRQMQASKAPTYFAVNATVFGCGQSVQLLNVFQMFLCQ